jgi:hypothetical protein
MIKTIVRASRLVLLIGLLTVDGVGHAADDPVPEGYHLVWADEFAKLSLRTGGPTYYGLETGSGTWSAPGELIGDPRGGPGYGYDWFVDPSYYGWPGGYHGQFAITSDGLRIRAEAPPLALAKLYPHVNRSPEPTTATWMSGQITSWHAVRIKPPFYFEARAKMPVGNGRPWPAIWLATGQHRPAPNDHGKEYEIDVHEGFGESTKLNSTIHWNPYAMLSTYPAYNVVDSPSGVDLSAGFNVWGCYVTKTQQVFYFNGVEVGRVQTPAAANADQPYGIILDVSAGLPWKGGGPPSGGPYDMTVRYVRLYAPNPSGLTVR